MKAAKNEATAIILLSFMIIVSMIINVYNGTAVYILREGETAAFDWNFFGWWAVSFGGAILLFAASQTIYQEKKTGSEIVMSLTVLLAIFAILLVIF